VRRVSDPDVSILLDNGAKSEFGSWYRPRPPGCLACARGRAPGCTP